MLPSATAVVLSVESFRSAGVVFRPSWAKVMEMADKLPTYLPTADNTIKTFTFENAMVAGQQAGNFEKIVEYGDKVLEIYEQGNAALARGCHP